jgi:hypothetical protein
MPSVTHIPGKPNLILGAYDIASVGYSADEFFVSGTASSYGRDGALGTADYTTRMVACSEEKAWEFTAVAARLGKANGAYRGPNGSTYVFMTYGEIKLEKK